MMDEFQEMQRMNLVQSRREAAFGEATAFYTYRFERDDGSVPKLAEAKNYADRWEEMRCSGIGLLLWGLPGNGKTFAAACIANALCEKMADVRMVTLAEVLSRLPAMSAEDKLYYLRSLRRCDLLILDDFGMERRTEYAQEQVFSLINGRYLSGRPLIVTTNLSLQELKEPTDMTEQRIFDRILERCVPVCFEGPGLRPHKAKETMARYKELSGR